MATNTYVALQKTTLNGSSSSITFSSIPSTYTDLIIIFNGAGSTANLFMQFNGDTGSNYSYTRMYGNGSSAGSDRGTSATGIAIGYVLSTGITNNILQVQNYSNTTTYKTAIGRADNANDSAQTGVGLWRSTSAINSITLFNGTSSNFTSGSTFSLYGIAAEGTTAKATGGYITSDSTYWYHTFTSSGTFTPTQSLTCDYLTVAGGGGSGYSSYAGGGGAGGYIYSTGFSASVTGYTVTVGAGGAAIASAGSKGNNGSNSQFGSTTAAVGGGGGGSYGVSSSYWNGASGGSGGGGSSDTGTGGAATSGQGYAGGAANANGGGAGGGSSAVGTSYTSGSLGLTVAGGAGTANSISGTSVTYATGGRGRSQNAADTVQTGTANTGNGGGAGAGSSGAGGSGIVIVRYAK